jgi:hypothetical protein
MSDARLSKSGLDWALMICTYNRQELLTRCVRQAPTQTRPPKEVVIPNLLLMDWYGTLVIEFENTVPARPMRGAHV